ncbi:hypothetical protein [Noviherbaspirillum galbum]|uniref:hypothetical protein n=1 Tax=Noviherbaspirillum galbum TaxID=2709383 RepID=UPI0013D263E4|nr:hypothetical protein [Noviherbaspirillum galbum]
MPMNVIDGKPVQAGIGRTDFAIPADVAAGPAGNVSRRQAWLLALEHAWLGSMQARSGRQAGPGRVPEDAGKARSGGNDDGNGGELPSRLIPAIAFPNERADSECEANIPRAVGQPSAATASRLVNAGPRHPELADAGRPTGGEAEAQKSWGSTSAISERPAVRQDSFDAMPHASTARAAEEPGRAPFGERLKAGRAVMAGGAVRMDVSHAGAASSSIDAGTPVAAHSASTDPVWPGMLVGAENANARNPSVPATPSPSVIAAGTASIAISPILTVPVGLPIAGQPYPRGASPSAGAPFALPETAVETSHESLDSKASSGKLGGTAGEAPPARNVHVYRDARGVQAWIRDAALDAADAEAVSRALQEEFLRSGESISAIHVNGKMISATVSPGKAGAASIATHDEGLHLGGDHGGPAAEESELVYQPAPGASIHGH